MLKWAFWCVCGVMALVVLLTLSFWKYTNPINRIEMNSTTSPPLSFLPTLSRSLPFVLLDNDPTDNMNFGKMFSSSPPNQRLLHTLGLPTRPTLPVPLNVSTNNFAMGSLNYDVWHWIVGYLVDDLRINRYFPLSPDYRVNISSFHIEFDEADPADLRGRYGHKIYGYLFPSMTGYHTFQVELTEMTAAASVELWISPNGNPAEMEKILYLVYDDMSRPEKRAKTSKEGVSASVYLSSKYHYFEFLEKAFEGKVVTDVKWKPPWSDDFIAIPSTNYAMAVKLDENGDYQKGQGIVTSLQNKSLPSNLLQAHHRYTGAAMDIRPFTSLDVLPHCEFSSQYAHPHTVQRMHGPREVKQSKVYPHDGSWFHNFKKADKGNLYIYDEMMEKVKRYYAAALASSKHVNGTLVGIHYMEESDNKKDGLRYLLEMDVQLNHPRKELVHTSEYAYLKKEPSQLCHTSNFQWVKDTYVYFIVAVKNLAQWVRHLIFNMEDIYAETKDEHFSLIIVDCESEDMNVEEEAKQSSFKKITVLHLKGAFTRSGGLQKGIEHVTDPEAIVMTIDMHLTLPPGFLQYVRKHTIKNKMALTPMFFKLNKGYTEINLNGMWGIWTYGLNAMFKSDWTKVGGFNVTRYGTKWGNEDVDVLDKLLSHGMEAFRIRPPGLIHYHHTRKGMWGSNDIFLKKGLKNH